jgi:hypothetical protein
MKEKAILNSFLYERVAQLVEHLTFKIRSLIEKFISENVANSGKAKSLICQSRARSLMNSKDKGNIGEAIVLGEFVKRNIQVSIPFGDNARYDLVADFNGKLNKIQVKYCNQKITENNSISCPCSSSKNHTTNKCLSSYENDVDYIAFYLVEWNYPLLVPISVIGTRKTMVFRKTKPLNNQSNVNLIEDYSFDKTLCVETLHDEPKSND